MNVSVFGLGYVGSVSAACFANDGHKVIGVDVNADKVNAVNAGQSPVIEPGLGEIIASMVSANRLHAVTDSASAVHQSDVSLICVGTPSQSNGNLELTYVENVCREIGNALRDKDGYHVVTIRSTVLPNTVEGRLIPVLEEASCKRAGEDFGVCMNPEFLREGTAVADYVHPSQIVIGELDRRSGDRVEAVYDQIEAPVVRTSLRTAEMVKYVNNAFHALKVVFANEIGNLCKAHEIDGQNVMDVFCQDKQLNISATYLRPGFAFGGSCLPKDLRALLYNAKERDVDVPVLQAILPSNQQQVARGIEFVERTKRRRIGVFGLSFKSGTDDVRESPVVPLVETLVGRGYNVSVYDEIIDPKRLIGANKAFLERELPHIASLMRSSIDEVVSDSEVLVVTNRSKAFARVPSLARNNQIIIDLAGLGTQNGARLNGNYNGICW